MRALPHLLALWLGAACALLVACGGTGGTTGGVPAASAGGLKSELEDVGQAVDDGRCEDVSGQLRQVDTAIDDLPASVDERLRQALRDASDKLRRVAVSECSEEQPTQTAPAQTQTQTQTTETQTVPTETQTVPTQTQTTPPQTTPAPVAPVPPPPVEQPPAPVPPPVEPPAAPPGTPGGGAEPEIEP